MNSDTEKDVDENEDEGSYSEHKSEYGLNGMPQSWLDGEMVEWFTDLLIFNFMIDDDHMLPTHHINADHETRHKQLTDDNKNTD